MASSQLARHLKLIDRLHSARGCTANELASEFEVSRRTVFRDLRSLEAAGIQIHLDAENRYQVAPHFSRQAPKLFSDELVALALAASASPISKAPDFSVGLDTALGKLLNRATDDERKQVARVLKALHFDTSEEFAELAGTIGKFGKIVSAIANASAIRLTCRSRGVQESYERVEPVFLRTNTKPWLVEVRTGNLNQLTAIPLPQIVDVQMCEPGVQR